MTNEDKIEVINKLLIEVIGSMGTNQVVLDDTGTAIVYPLQLDTNAPRNEDWAASEEWQYSSC